MFPRVKSRKEKLAEDFEKIKTKDTMRNYCILPETRNKFLL